MVDVLHYALRKEMGFKRHQEGKEDVGVFFSTSSVFARLFVFCLFPFLFLQLCDLLNLARGVDFRFTMYAN